MVRAGPGLLLVLLLVWHDELPEGAYNDAYNEAYNEQLPQGSNDTISAYRQLKGSTAQLRARSRSSRPSFTMSQVMQISHLRSKANKAKRAEKAAKTLRDHHDDDGQDGVKSRRGGAE